MQQGYKFCLSDHKKLFLGALWGRTECRASCSPHRGAEHLSCNGEISPLGGRDDSSNKAGAHAAKQHNAEVRGARPSAEVLVHRVGPAQLPPDGRAQQRAQPARQPHGAQSWAASPEQSLRER